MIKEGLVMINVPGRNGYSFVVKCDNENDAIDRALCAGLFSDDEDAEYATTDFVTDTDYEFFKNDIVEI